MKEYIGFEGYRLSEDALRHAKHVHRVCMGKDNIAIVNPCGEVPLYLQGGYCVLGDVCPYHIWQDADPYRFDQVMLSEITKGVQFLMRTNLLDSLYRGEVDRTNRIGLGLIGMFEYAWARYEANFYDLVKNPYHNFWRDLAQWSNAAVEAADAYAAHLGVVCPDTVLTIPPSGSKSKLFGLTEGAHLPSMAWYLRFVQYRSDDPLVEEHRRNGYPTKGPLRTYTDTTVVGFPTIIELAKIMPPDKLVTAAMPTVAEQFEWVRLLERNWLAGGHVQHKRGGQISYTLKYDPAKVSMHDLDEAMREYLPQVRCVSIMPQESIDNSAYEYLPEEPITWEQYEAIVANIKTGATEGVDIEHVKCEGGACPVEF
jgi:hypothetical protein